MTIIEELRESKNQFEVLENLLEGSEFLRSFKESRIGYDRGIPRIILTVMHNYPEFVKVMKEVKKISKDLKFENNFFSCGVMIFTWESNLLKLWFECYPDEIPQELIPSSSCKVVRTEKTVEEDYRIVCEVE